MPAAPVKPRIGPHYNIYQRSITMSLYNLKSRVLTLAGVALLASSALLPGLSVADDMSTGGPPAEFVNYLKMKPVDIMHMMDTTNRGKVTKAEFMKFQEEMFDKMDKNHDGFLDAREFGISAP
jgi:EF hand